MARSHGNTLEPYDRSAVLVTLRTHVLIPWKWRALQPHCLQSIRSVHHHLCHQGIFHFEQQSPLPIKADVWRGNNKPSVTSRVKRSTKVTDLISLFQSCWPSFHWKQKLTHIILTLTFKSMSLLCLPVGNLEERSICFFTFLSPEIMCTSMSAHVPHILRTTWSSLLETEAALHSSTGPTKCFWNAQHMINNWQLKEQGYLTRFGHTEALL